MVGIKVDDAGVEEAQSRSLVALSVLVCAEPAFGALYDSMASLPSGKEYDYIIVGSGIGGGVLGRRLSEDSGRNVLIIEAGGNPDGDVKTEAPFLAPSLIGGSHDWNYSTTAQPGLDGRIVKYPRGKVLGGTSTLHFTVWNRGGSDDYDRWAALTGDDGWNWENMIPYFKKSEGPVTPPNGHDISSQWISADHGTDGPLAVTIQPFAMPSEPKILNMSSHQPEFPYIADMSAGNEIGIAWMPMTVGSDGKRASSWTHFLRPVINRDNLDIVMNTQVTRVLQTGTDNGSPAFRGVEYAANSTATRNTINATREVILSAGAMGSPQILMLSGIGDKTTLSALGISTIIENSNVGQWLQDHPLLTNSWSVVDDVFTLDAMKQNSTALAQELAIWQANGTGPLTLAGPNQLGFFRNPSNVAPFNTEEDPSAGVTCGHYQMGFDCTFLSLTQSEPATGKYFTVITNVASPKAFGNVTITSKDPFTAPTINPNLLGTYYDVATMREAIKAAAAVANTEAMKTDFIVAPYGALADALADGSNTAIEAYAQGYTTTVWHPACSTRMTTKDGKDGVLDASLKVIGAAGLRVVDAGSFPRIPASNIQASVYALAERGADLIKAANA